MEVVRSRLMGRVRKGDQSSHGFSCAFLRPRLERSRESGEIDREARPSAVTPPPWRSAIARTIARPRPEPSLRSPARARSARRRAGLLGGEAGALVGDPRRARSPSRSTVTVTARPAGRAARVARRGCRPRARAPAARRGRAAARGANTVASASAAVARELGEVDRLAAHRRRGVLARERQQVVEQVAEARGVGLEVGQHLGVGAVAGDVRRRCRAARSAACAARARRRRRSAARPRARARATRASR